MSGARPRVAYQGGPGAYGEAAIAAYWAGGALAEPRRTFPALVAAVAEGEVEWGVVPVWNSAIGAVRDACAALAAAGDLVEWVDEVTVPVRHALLALPGATLAGLRAAGSHPAALAQCARFFAAHPAIAPVDAWDTAGAAAELAALAALADGAGPPAGAWFAGVGHAGPRALAVVASPAVAPALGLAVLAEEIQDDPANATRFAVTRTRRGPWRR